MASKKSKVQSGPSAVATEATANGVQASAAEFEGRQDPHSPRRKKRNRLEWMYAVVSLDEQGFPVRVEAFADTIGQARKLTKQMQGMTYFSAIGLATYKMLCVDE